MPYRSSEVLAGNAAVPVGVVDTPATLVHWSRDSAALSGTTVGSDVPCQIATLGRGPVYPEKAPRTRSPHCAGVRSTPGFMHENALTMLVAQRYGRPAMTEPPAKTSG